MRVIASQGARKFTARSLAREVGITDGAVFRHFTSMDAIGDAVVERMESMLFADFPPRNEDPMARLGVFFARRVAVIVENPHLSRLLLSDHLAQFASPACAVRIEGFKRRSREFVLACLREAEKNGQLRGAAGCEEGAVLVQGAILALAHAGTRPKRERGLEVLSSSVWSVLESMLLGTDRKKPTTRRKP
jgi:AcrR family transcriptional regulator